MSTLLINENDDDDDVDQSLNHSISLIICFLSQNGRCIVILRRTGHYDALIHCSIVI